MAKQVDAAKALCGLLLELRRWHNASLRMVVLPSGARISVDLRGQQFTTEGSALELTVALDSWLNSLGPGCRPTQSQRAALHPARTVNDTAYGSR